MNIDKELEWAWNRLGDILVNDNEEIDEEFTIHYTNIASGDITFDRGTDIYEIWHYFDDEHSKGVAFLMNLI